MRQNKCFGFSDTLEWDICSKLIIFKNGWQVKIFHFYGRQGRGFRLFFRLNFFFFCSLNLSSEILGSIVFARSYLEKGCFNNISNIFLALKCIADSKFIFIVQIPSIISWLFLVLILLLNVEILSSQKI